MLEFNSYEIDLDGDGIADATGIDIDGDGVIDVLAVDTDGNGVFDTYLSDTDGDGLYETTMIDTDENGAVDIIMTDLNGDGFFDVLQQDTNGDGSFDVTMVDTDGDGYFDAQFIDTDHDGTVDMMVSEHDTDGDGTIDTVIKSFDYDQDGNFESVTTYTDVNNDGIFDIVTKAYDSDGNGTIDTVKTYYDFDGDGSADAVVEEQYIDSDGDGNIDTYVNRIDSDGDGVFESTEVYGYDAATGQVELSYVDGAASNIGGMRAEDLQNFDPDNADPDAVTGDPASSMEKWECQGHTNRCALYSQKFVIEELTDEDIDIEELAKLAEENGWFTEKDGTAFLNMNKVLEYYGVENEMSFHNDIDDIREVLGSGGKVIVSIDSDEIWRGESNDLFTPADGANHAVEVIGIDDSNPDQPMVILNDSGSPDGCGEMVPLDTFLDAWEDGNCQMISCI